MAMYGLPCGEVNNIALWFVSVFENMCCISRYSMWVWCVRNGADPTTVMLINQDNYDDYPEFGDPSF